jgi:uncharacterized protein (DUF2141 family)
MASFQYNISTTGACSTSGTISLQLAGGTPPYTVQWTTPNLGVDTVYSNPSVRTGLSAGEYTVSVNDSTLPTNLEFFINIPVSSGVCADVSGVVNTTCGLNNGSITGSSTSNYSSTNFYLYSGSDVYITSAVTNTNEAIFQNLTAGTYYLLVQDIGGCTGVSETIIVEESSPMDFGLYVVPNSSCGGAPLGKLYVTGQTGTAPYTYLWSNNQTTSSITGLTSGNYTVTVTDAAGCVVTKNAVIFDVDPVGFGNFIVTQPTCFSSNGVVTLVITGGTSPYYYSASSGNYEISYAQTFTVSGLPSGSYSVTVTDSGFCTFTQTTELLTPNGISSVSIQGNNSSCSDNDGSIQISVVNGTTPYTYTLVNPNGDTSVVSTSNSSNTFSSLSGGTYFVSVQDFSGCSYGDSVTIVTENLFTITGSTTGTTCGQNNGQITIVKSTGGTEPYNYLLDGVVQVANTIQSAVTLTNITSGSHSVSVSDANGCIQTRQIFIDSSEPLTYSLISTSCGTGDQGTMTAFISSGEPPFTFSWSNNIAGNPQSITVTGLTAGTYSVTVVDSLGCSLRRSMDVNCTQNLISYQVYVMGNEVFQSKGGTKCGLLQMMNEGFYDLTLTNTNCILISADFIAKVTVEPLGSVYTSQFFTTTSLLVAPSDNQWYNAIETLLMTIPGIIGVSIDALNNKITIQTNVDGPLQNQILTIDVLIEYDVRCES